jgi:signal transduction histidine kinase
LAVLIATMAVLGLWIGDQIDGAVLNRTAGITALYVDSIIAPSLQSLAVGPALSPDDTRSLARLLTDTPLGDRIVAFKVWSLDGTILYSPDARLVGRRFAIEGGLAPAVRGEVSAELSDLDEPENAFERLHWSRLLEVYVPVRERRTGRLIAVAEFYQPPDELDRDIAGARARSWAVVVAVTLATYLLLGGIVKRGSDTIKRQQTDLRAKVAELTALLDQNANLRERLHQAAGRATAINEQALRRISADLHDGPGQSLALALLRLDSVEEPAGGSEVAGANLGAVQHAIAEALGEIRAISAGLRLPDLAPLGVADVVDRVARNHARLTGTVVAPELGALPDAAPLAVKIALFRALQEALSNATRHANGADVRARVWGESGFLHLSVSDRGPGFDPEAVRAKGRLGLAGMREQAELLGGGFAVASRPGQGTTLELRWPCGEPEGR